MKDINLKRALDGFVSDFIYSSARAHHILIDLLASFFAFKFFFIISPFFRSSFDPSVVNLTSFCYAISFTCFALGLGYYERNQRTSISLSLRSCLFSSLFATLGALIAVYMIYYDKLGRVTFMWAGSGALTCCLVIRLVVLFLSKLTSFNFTQLGKEVFDGTYTDESIPRSPKVKRSKYRYYRWTDIPEPKITNLKKLRIKEVIYSSDALVDRDYMLNLFSIKRSGINVSSTNGFYGKLFERFPYLDLLNKDEVLRSNPKESSLSSKVIRLLDILLSGLGLVILSPLFGVIAIASMIDSAGPVFFIQPRCGRYGEKFYMYKFRSMSIGSSCVNASGGFTEAGDVRITRLGRLLRPLHLDELPQLINIFKGDMSLVGPRPEAFNFSRDMSAQINMYDLRYMVRPGLTGHAQLKAGYCLDSVSDTEKKLSYDLFYILNYSIMMYFRILLRTFFIVLLRLVSHNTEDVTLVERKIHTTNVAS